MSIPQFSIGYLKTMSRTMTSLTCCVYILYLKISSEHTLNAAFSILLFQTEFYQRPASFVFTTNALSSYFLISRLFLQDWIAGELLEQWQWLSYTQEMGAMGGDFSQEYTFQIA